MKLRILNSSSSIDTIAILFWSFVKLLPELQAILLTILHKIENLQIGGKLIQNYFGFTGCCNCVSEREFEYVTVENFLYSVTFVLYESYMTTVHKGKKYSKSEMSKKPARRER